MTNRRLHTLLFLLLLLLCTDTLYSEGGKFALSADSLKPLDKDFAIGKRLIADWKFNSSDSLSFASLTYNDNHWKSTPSNFIRSAQKKMGWKNIGWFRITITLDSSVKNTGLALLLDHLGASELYVNGTRISKNGIPDKTSAEESPYNPSRLPVFYYTGMDSILVIAVRYSNASLNALTDNFPASPYQYGFSFFYGLADVVTEQTDKAIAFIFPVQLIIFGILIALGIAHLIVSFYHRKDKSNRYYAYFAFSLGLTFWAGYINSVTHQPLISILSFFMQMITLTIVFCSFVALMHTVGYGETRKRIKIYLITALIPSVLFYVVDAGPVFIGIIIYMLSAIIDGFTALIYAARKKKDGVRIILIGAAGFAVLILFSLATNIAQENLLSVYFSLTLLYVGFLSIPLSMSVYLARSFAKTNDELEKKIIETNELNERTLLQERKEAVLRLENERKSAELEGARKIQLSMLPSEVPALPGYTVAFTMLTAAEVGGDFYDYKITSPDEFTFVVGDATGHGVKAGIMVAAAKTLFSTTNSITNIPDFFRFFTRSLKQLNLGILYLSLTLVKFTKNSFVLSCAGMPPVLHYRKATETVDTLTTKAMPLGKFDNFPYTELQGEMLSGDVMVIMSDGLMESFSREKELLGTDPIIETLLKNKTAEPSEIVSALLALSFQWSGAAVPTDDISLVVIKKV